MSFQIDLIKNLSDTNVVDKNLTTLSSVTGSLKEATSIINPVIKIAGPIPSDCNYFYIAEFNRYYYINDLKSIHDNLYEISGHVDVLKTYASQIRGCTGIVARNAYKYNLYLDDGSFKTYQNPKFKKINFPQGFSTMEFVLAVAGRQ